MVEITATEAAKRFGEFLEQVVAGETYIVTRHGRPVLEMRPHAPPAHGPLKADLKAEADGG